MQSSFDLNSLKQYEVIFGRPKMQVLFDDFKNKSKNELLMVDGLVTRKAQDELRLIYHSLRSSSLVFGMRGFSKICEAIEEKILNHLECSEEIKTSKKLFEEELFQVVEYLHD